MRSSRKAIMPQRNRCRLSGVRRPWGWLGVACLMAALAHGTVPQDTPAQQNPGSPQATVSPPAPIQEGAAPRQAPASRPTPVSQQEFWAEFDQRDWDSAIAAADKLVASLRPTLPASALPLAEALSLLGNAQLRKGNLVAAESAFTEALQLVEQHANRTSIKLVDPLRGLGYTMAAGGHHEQAVTYMNRALLLSRRNAGLFDLSQQGLLRQLAASLTKLGQAAEGEKHMQYLLRMGEHAYGAEDVRMVPLYCVVGDWYVGVGATEVARAHYRAALRLLEDKKQDGGIAAVQPLRGLAKSYTDEVLLSYFGIIVRVERTPFSGEVAESRAPLNPKGLSDEGERALQRALQILEPQRQTARPTLLETLLQAGDWFTMKQQADKALPFYLRALSVANAVPPIAGAESLLSFPMVVFYPTPSLAARNLNLPDGTANERYVQLEFTVEADGSVSGASIVEADATERQKSQALEAIQAARYRPKFVDGKPAVTSAMRYRQVFRERKEDDKESDPKVDQDKKTT